MEILAHICIKLAKAPYAFFGRLFDIGSNLSNAVLSAEQTKRILLIVHNMVVVMQQKGRNDLPREIFLGEAKYLLPDDLPMMDKYRF